MLVKIFKFSTSLLLIAILMVLASKRELSITLEEKIKDAISPNVMSATPILAPVTQLLEASDVSSSSGKEEPKETTLTPLQKTNPQIPSITEPVAYVSMTENSDTDETYVPVAPCKEPIGFKLGKFDSRFGLSREQFIQDTSKAAAIWEESAGKSLFMYDENGPLTINLIYDERQAKTENLGYTALEIENAKANAEKLKQDYEKEKEEYDLKGQLFTASSTTFKEKYDSYEARVKEYNQKGGAPKAEYDKMMIELASLQEESKTLEAIRLELLAEMEAINKKVNRYNEFVVYVNDLIKKSNALGAQKFTEGRYTPSTNTIDIYQYSDPVKRIRVLAHELGHVLGINHNKNARSIMYSVNSGTDTLLTTEDQEALIAACK